MKRKICFKIYNLYFIIYSQIKYLYKFEIIFSPLIFCPIAFHSFDSFLDRYFVVVIGINFFDNPPSDACDAFFQQHAFFFR